MDLSLASDEFARLICTLQDGSTTATVTASNVPAAGRDLLAAVDGAQADGAGECWWEEQGGEYRWMLRRDGNRLTVVVLWSSGTITGWQHVFRQECDFDWFRGRLRAELDALPATSA